MYLNETSSSIATSWSQCETSCTLASQTSWYGVLQTKDVETFFILRTFIPCSDNVVKINLLRLFLGPFIFFMTVSEVFIELLGL
jgi:hypothetical protein